MIASKQDYTKVALFSLGLGPNGRLASKRICRPEAAHVLVSRAERSIVREISTAPRDLDEGRP
jgi:hypothetical protein